jgi:hypothetical protein
MIYAIRDMSGKIVGHAKWKTTTGADQEPIDQESQEWIDYLQSIEE